MKTPNGQCTKRCKLLKVTKTKKNSEKPKKSKSLGWDLPLQKILDLFFVFWFFFVFGCFFVFQGLYLFSKSLGWPPPFQRAWKYYFVLVFFSKVFTKCRVPQGNWHESQAKLSKRPWECSKKHLKI